jgi:hypothetical protein
VLSMYCILACFSSLLFVIQTLRFIFQLNLTCFKRLVKANQLNKVENYPVVNSLFCSLVPGGEIFPVLVSFFVFPRVRPFERGRRTSSPLWLYLHFNPSLRVIETPWRERIPVDRF